MGHPASSERGVLHYGVVNDGYNAPIISYSKGRVEVKNTINVLIGDANQDGVVDNRDVQDINAARASLLIACDVNKPIGTCDDKDASLISQALDANGNLKPLSKRPRSLNSLHKRKRIGETVAVIMPASSTSFAVQGIPIEALKNLQEVIALILEDMQAHDEPIPVGRGVTVSLEPKVTVTV